MNARGLVDVVTDVVAVLLNLQQNKYLSQMLTLKNETAETSLKTRKCENEKFCRVDSSSNKKKKIYLHLLQHRAL